MDIKKIIYKALLIFGIILLTFSSVLLVVCEEFFTKIENPTTLIFIGVVILSVFNSILLALILKDSE